MSIRLNKWIRAEIYRLAMKATIDKDRKELQDKTHRLAEKLMEQVMPLKQREAIRVLADTGWLRVSNEIQVNCGGNTYRFEMSKSIPSPYNGWWNERKIVVPPDMVQTFHDLMSEHEAHKEKYRAAHTQLEQLLASVSSVERLREVWPLGEKYIAEALKSLSVPTNTPLVPLAHKVDEALGLPRDEESPDAKGEVLPG